MPISFYLIDNADKHNTAYTTSEQEADKETGIEIYHNEILRNKKIKEKNYEFLLAPDDTHTIRHALYEGVPLLLHIFSEGYVHIARSLIEKNAQNSYEHFFDIFNSTQHRRHIVPAIEHATRCGDELFVNFLLAVTNEKPYNFDRFFHIAAENSHLNLMQLLIAKSENTIKPETILSAFISAANTGHKDVADTLLQKVGNIENKDDFFHDWQIHCVKMMIEKNPTLFVQDLKWFYLTIVYNLEESAEKLLTAGVDINATCCPSHFTTPLNQALEHENKEMLNWLLLKGADANAAMLKLPMQYHAAHATARPYIYATLEAINFILGLFLTMDGIVRGEPDPNKGYQYHSKIPPLEFAAGFMLFFAAIGLLLFAGRKQTNEWWKLHVFYNSFSRYLNSLFPTAVNLPNQEMFSLMLKHANTASENRILRDLGEITEQHNVSSSSFGFFACIAKKQALSEKKTAEKFVAILNGSDTVVLDKNDYSTLAKSRFSQIFQPAPPLSEIRVEEPETGNIKEPLLLMRGG